MQAEEDRDAVMIELFVSCANLPSLDLFSASDPFVVVSALNEQNQWKELARTETIRNNNNPSFAAQIKIGYQFELTQPLRFRVYDEDVAKTSEIIGEVEATVGRILGSKSSSLTLPLGKTLRGGKSARVMQSSQAAESSGSIASASAGASATGVAASSGDLTSAPSTRRMVPTSSRLAVGAEGRVATITITAAETCETRDRIRVIFAARSLDRKDLFGSSDPFLVVCRVTPDGATKFRVWESPVVKRNVNPIWPAVDIPVQLICNGDWYSPIVIEVWDWNRRGVHSFIGEVRCCAADLVLPRDAEEDGAGDEAVASAAAAIAAAKPSTGDSGSNGSSGSATAAWDPLRCWPVINPTKAMRRGGRGYVHSGLLSVVSSEVIRVPCLVDYLRGGLQLGLIAAVDMTGSNGHPAVPSSLHYVSPSVPNQYLQALSATASILLDYDYDKLVPVYGFGGAVGGGPVSHCFALTFNESKPEVYGLDGILAVYKNAFSFVALAGPTYFAPVIRRACRAAAAPGARGSLKYTILLLLSDGACNDWDDTVDAIIEASLLPMSIVIVGIGNADFTNLEFLDGDGTLLKSSRDGRVAARDIVQFVPFKAFLDEDGVMNAAKAEAAAPSPGLTSAPSFSSQAGSPGGGAGAAAGRAKSNPFLSEPGMNLARTVLAEIPDQVVSYFMMNGIMPKDAVPIPVSGQ